MKGAVKALAIAWSLAAAVAHAADAMPAAHRYAALSLIGDAVDIVTHQVTIGSNRDRNRHEPVATPDAVFDRAVLLAVDATLRKLEPGTAVTMLATRSPHLYTDQDKLVVDSHVVLPPEIASVLAQSGATHLVLATKHRDEARLQAADRNIGSGKLEGIGFYVDRSLPTRQFEGGARGYGFLAPFAYIKLRWIDVASGRILREQIVEATTTISAARGESGYDPWQALSAEEKMEALRAMIYREVARAVPTLLAGG